MPDAPEGRGRPHLTSAAAGLARYSGNTRAMLSSDQSPFNLIEQPGK